MQKYIQDLIRSREYWKRMSQSSSGLIRRLQLRVGLLEDACESLCAYASRLRKCVYCEDALSRDKELKEMADLYLEEVADERREAAFGESGGKKLEKQVRDDATIMRMRMDVSVAVASLRKIVPNAPKDVTLAQLAQMVVEAYNVGK